MIINKYTIKSFIFPQVDCRRSIALGRYWWRVSCYGLIALSQLLWVGCYGLIAVGWLLWVGVNWSVTLGWLLVVCCKIICIYVLSGYMSRLFEFYICGFSISMSFYMYVFFIYIYLYIPSQNNCPIATISKQLSSVPELLSQSNHLRAIVQATIKMTFLKQPSLVPKQLSKWLSKQPSYSNHPPS